MRISDWSSDVCSSDLHHHGAARRRRIDDDGFLVAAAAGGQHQRHRQHGKHDRDFRPGSDRHDVTSSFWQITASAPEMAAMARGRKRCRVYVMAVGVKSQPAKIFAYAITRSEEHTSELQSLMRS